MTLSWRDATISDSRLARWDTRWKLAAFLVFGLTVLLQQSPVGVFLGFLLVLPLAVLARVPPMVVLGRIGLLLLVAVPLLIIVPLTQPSAWPLALMALLRIVTLGLLALVLLRSAPLARVLSAARQLGFPRVLIVLIQLAYRYSFVIASEVRRVRIALRSRGFRLQTDVRTYRTLSYAIGGVLVQSSDRAERVADAMRCRGFHGEFPTLSRFQTSRADVLGFLVLAGLGLTMLVLGYLT